MPDYPEIYARHAGQYQALVAREDHAGNLPRMLGRIAPCAGKAVVELGAGTGRLTCMLAPLAASVHAFDRSPAMLQVAAARLRSLGLVNWLAAVADHRHLPLPGGTAHLVLAGWSVCYLVVEHPGAWQPPLSRALSEMQRLLRPGGRLLLIETLGTGVESPAPPQDLVPYYHYLEARGFRREWTRTDYLFPSQEEAASLTRFFFGEEMVASLRREESGVILPECTGFWWRPAEAGDPAEG